MAENEKEMCDFDMAPVVADVSSFSEEISLHDIIEEELHPCADSSNENNTFVSDPAANTPGTFKSKEVSQRRIDFNSMKYPDSFADELFSFTASAQETSVSEGGREVDVDENAKQPADIDLETLLMNMDSMLAMDGQQRVDAVVDEIRCLNPVDDSILFSSDFQVNILNNEIVNDMDKVTEGNEPRNINHCDSSPNGISRTEFDCAVDPDVIDIDVRAPNMTATERKSVSAEANTPLTREGVFDDESNRIIQPDDIETSAPSNFEGDFNQSWALTSDQINLDCGVAPNPGYSEHHSFSEELHESSTAPSRVVQNTDARMHEIADDVSENMYNNADTSLKIAASDLQHIEAFDHNGTGFVDTQIASNDQKLSDDFKNEQQRCQKFNVHDYKEFEDLHENDHVPSAVAQHIDTDMSCSIQNQINVQVETATERMNSMVNVHAEQNNELCKDGADSIPSDEGNMLASVQNSDYMEFTDTITSNQQVLEHKNVVDSTAIDSDLVEPTFAVASCSTIAPKSSEGTDTVCEADEEFATFSATSPPPVVLSPKGSGFSFIQDSINDGARMTYEDMRAAPGPELVPRDLQQNASDVDDNFEFGDFSGAGQEQEDFDDFTSFHAPQAQHVSNTAYVDAANSGEDENFGDFQESSVIVPSTAAAASENVDALDDLIAQVFDRTFAATKNADQAIDRLPSDWECNLLLSMTEKVWWDSRVSEVVKKKFIDAIAQGAFSISDERLDAKKDECVSIEHLRNVLKTKFAQKVKMDIVNSQSPFYSECIAAIESGDMVDILKHLSILNNLIMNHEEAQQKLNIAKEAALSARFEIANQTENNTKLSLWDYFSRLAENSFEKREAFEKRESVGENGAPVFTPTGLGMSFSKADPYGDADEYSGRGGGSSGSDGEDGLLSKLSLKIAGKQTQFIVQIRRNERSSHLVQIQVDLDKVSGGFDQVKWQCAMALYDTAELVSITPSVITMYSYPQGEPFDEKSKKDPLIFFLKSPNTWAVDVTGKGFYRMSTTSSDPS